MFDSSFHTEIESNLKDIERLEELSIVGKALLNLKTNKDYLILEKYLLVDEFDKTIEEYMSPNITKEQKTIVEERLDVLRFLKDKLSDNGNIITQYKSYKSNIQELIKENKRLGESFNDRKNDY
jgi:hypothetical protein